MSGRSTDMSACIIDNAFRLRSTLKSSHAVIAITMAESTSQQSRPETHGSQTLTVNSTSNVPEASTTESASDSREGTPSSVGVLRLRGGPVRRNHVAWSSETVDNEGLGKKKSKSEPSQFAMLTVQSVAYITSRGNSTNPRPSRTTHLTMSKILAAAMPAAVRRVKAFGVLPVLKLRRRVPNRRRRGVLAMEVPGES